MHKEAIRYLNNAKELLSKSPIDGKYYTDVKYVKSACGIAYLGILEGIKDYLLAQGLTKKELPKKVEEFRKALQKHASVYNGKLSKEFDFLYDELHIAGYYHGTLHTVDSVKSVMKRSKEFIDKVR